VVLRGKEWFGNSAGVSAGIMTWIAYIPDDGTEVRGLEAWIPFQMKWDIPDSQQDGVIYAIPLLKSVDARSVSARKIMVRANACVQVQAYESRETEIFKADNLPEDVQILNQTYHFDLPVEAGEKVFQIEDVLQIQGNLQNTEAIYYYEISPQITESRILGDKLLFRGIATLHALYRGSDDSIKKLNQELEFSQYTHLDNVYSTDASALITPVVTGIELDFSGEQPIIKASLSAQYVIYESKAMEITEDAYSIAHNVDSEIGTLRLLSKLDSLTENVRLSHKFTLQPKEILDVICYPGCAQKIQNGVITQVQQPVFIQIIYTDQEESLQSASAQLKQTWELSTDPDNFVDIEILSITDRQCVINSDSVEFVANMQLRAVVCSENGLQMTQRIIIRDTKEVDPSRPSLVVRRIGDNSIWNIAKQYGARVSDIRASNKLDENSGNEQILLIPVP
jgi:hypothetical protein